MDAQGDKVSLDKGADEKSSAEDALTITFHYPVPGPGAYHPQVPESIENNSNPKYTFGSRTQTAPSSSSPTPGAQIVPSTFGITHDPTIAQQPAYSFDGGPPRDTLVKGDAPGPGTYNIEAHEAVGSGPAARIGTEDQRPAQLSKTAFVSEELAKHSNAGVHSPGPGVYDSPSKLGDAPKFTMRPKTGPKPAPDNRPGPGQYDLKTSFGREADPTFRHNEAFRFGTDVQRQDPQTNPKKAQYLGHEFDKIYQSINSPGPGRYEQSSQFQKGAHAPVFGKVPQRGGDPKLAFSYPGPGAYELQSKLGDGPKFSQGSSSKDYSGGRKLKDSASPGPQYNIYGRYGDPSPPRYKFGTNSRFTDKRAQLPGPGAYKSDDYLPLGKSGAAARFGTELQRPRPEENPKKVLYDGDETGNRVNKGIHSPGPGVYELPTTIGIAPKFRFGTETRPAPKSHELKLISTPGPGQYSAKSTFGRKAELTLRHGETYKFGSEDQRPRPESNGRRNPFLGKDFEVSNIGIHSPGPAQYSPDAAFSKTDRRSSSWAFSRGARFCSA